MVFSVSDGLTGEEEEAALDCASDGLQFDHVHGLADVHGAGHAPQGAPDVFGHLLNGEHLQQLIKYIGETVQQRCLWEGRRRGGTLKHDTDPKRHETCEPVFRERRGLQRAKTVSI